MLINARACAGGLGAAGTAASAAARVLMVAASAGRPPPALRAALRLGGGIHCVMMSARAGKVREMG